jgi:hypothetical protein
MGARVGRERRHECTTRTHTRLDVLCAEGTGCDIGRIEAHIERRAGRVDRTTDDARRHEHTVCAPLTERHRLVARYAQRLAVHALGGTRLDEERNGTLCGANLRQRGLVGGLRGECVLERQLVQL